MVKQTFKDFFHQTEHWKKPKYKRSKKKFTYAKLSAIPIGHGSGNCTGGGDSGSSGGDGGGGAPAGGGAGASGGGGGA